MPSIVFEFMEWGDLTEVLRTRSPWKLSSSNTNLPTSSAASDKIEDGDKKIPENECSQECSNRSSNESSITKQLTRVKSLINY